MKIIKETTNPDTFFYRYGFLLQRLTELQKMERVIKFKNVKPSQVKRGFLEQKPEIIHDLIIRCQNKYMSKYNTMKTKKGKLNKINAFKAEFEPFLPEMDSDNIAFLNQLVDSWIASLENE